GLLGIWQICALPKPLIDVWVLQQHADATLLQGENPYATEYPPIQDAVLYGPAVVRDGRIQTFPYPPLQLLLTLPGYLLGDVRYVMLAALLGAAAVMASVGRTGGEQSGWASELAAVLLLCHPQNCFILNWAWTEPLLCAAFAASVWSAIRRRYRL